MHGTGIAIETRPLPLRGLCGQFYDGKTATEKGRQQFFYLIFRVVGQGLGILPVKLMECPFKRLGLLERTPQSGKIGLLLFRAGDHRPI